MNSVKAQIGRHRRPRYSILLTMVMVALVFSRGSVALAYLQSNYPEVETEKGVVADVDSFLSPRSFLKKTDADLKNVSDEYKILNSPHRPRIPIELHRMVLLLKRTTAFRRALQFHAKYYESMRGKTSRSTEENLKKEQSKIQDVLDSLEGKMLSAKYSLDQAPELDSKTSENLKMKTDAAAIFTLFSQEVRQAKENFKAKMTSLGANEPLEVVSFDADSNIESEKSAKPKAKKFEFLRSGLEKISTNSPAIEQKFKKRVFAAPVNFEEPSRRLPPAN